MARRCEKSRCVAVWMKQNLPGGTSAVVPPDPMPNSAVKRRSADGSVGSPHARVGNCQASNCDKPSVKTEGFFTSIIPNLPHHFANLTPAHPQRTAMYNAGWPKRNQ